VAARILKMGWEDNFMFLSKMGCDVGYWMQVAEDRSSESCSISDVNSQY